MTLKINIIIYRWTVMLMGGGKCVLRVILSYNLYFCHIHNMTSYFGYVFRLLLWQVQKHVHHLWLASDIKIYINLTFLVPVKGKWTSHHNQWWGWHCVNSCLAFVSIRSGQEGRSSTSCWNNHCVRVGVSCVAAESCNLIHKTYWGKCSFSSTFVT